MKRIMMAAAAAGLLLGSPALAQKRGIDPRVQAAINCAGITDGAQRLRCYDQAIGGLRQAVQSGQLTVAPQPIRLEGVVKAAGPFGFNRMWVLLDSGDRWEVISTNNRDRLPRAGTKVRITKGPLGGYFFVQSLMPDRRAKYLGRAGN